MIINKDIMLLQTKELLKNLFVLPEIKKIAIKDSIIGSYEDNSHILKGINQCYHDKYSDIDITLWLSLNPADITAPHPYQSNLSRIGIDKSILGIAFTNGANDCKILRCCLNNGIRVFLCTSISSFLTQGHFSYHWPHSSPNQHRLSSSQVFPNRLKQITSFYFHIHRLP